MGVIHFDLFYPGKFLDGRANFCKNIYILYIYIYIYIFSTAILTFGKLKSRIKPILGRETNRKY